jgi:hypothetical protein
LSTSFVFGGLATGALRWPGDDGEVAGAFRRGDSRLGLGESAEVRRGERRLGVGGATMVFFGEAGGVAGVRRGDVRVGLELARVAWFDFLGPPLVRAMMFVLVPTNTKQQNKSQPSRSTN